jgi:phage baseplate assembly protein W
MSLHIASPLATDGRGRTASADLERHLAGMLERLLFTGPGERVMRPDFGTGLSELVFAPGDDELAIATRFVVEGAIQHWLGDRIAIEALSTSFDDGKLTISLGYSILATDERSTLTLERVL